MRKAFQRSHALRFRLKSKTTHHARVLCHACTHTRAYAVKKITTRQKTRAASCMHARSRICFSRETQRVETRVLRRACTHTRASRVFSQGIANLAARLPLTLDVIGKGARGCKGKGVCVYVYMYVYIYIYIYIYMCIRHNYA